MFLLELKLCGELREFSEFDREPDYDEEYDDANSVIRDLCEILSESQCVKFDVRGFGQENWPVDIETDLASILEQIPDLLNALDKKISPLYLDFYEQGIQRQLVFENKNTKLVSITCLSGTSWIPEPMTIFLEQEYVKKQMVALKTTFTKIVNIVSPKLCSSELFRAWSI